MSVIDEYVDGLSGQEKIIVEHMNHIIRLTVMSATEEKYYGMPSFKYKGKGLISILVNNRFLSLYPYCAVEKLKVDLSSYDVTKGSIHFSLDRPISDELLQQILHARREMIEKS